MAEMIPLIMSKEEFNGSMGEEAIYNALKGLPDEYVVFHSIGWSRKNENGYVRWGEADFTIYNPHRGILVVEVKSGKISCVDNRIIQENSQTGEKKIIYPLDQANRSKHTFIDILKENMNEDIWVESAIWFTSVEKENITGRFPLSYHDEIVLCKKDIKQAENAINSVFDFYQMRHHGFYDKKISSEVVKILAPKFNAVPTIATLAEEQNYYFNKLTSEQGYLLDYLEEQETAAIQGGAGTGKTMLAIEKVRRLSQQDDVIFLCFNKLLVGYLKNKFSDEMPRVKFTNLYALASAALDKEADEEDVNIFLNNYDQYDSWKYKHIIIDEGQDFSEEQIKLLYDIAKIEEGCFYVFYDKNQLVQQRNSLSWAKGIECRLILTRNCRNTRCIAETSGLPIDFTDIKMRLNIQGRKPNLYILKTNNEYIDTISKLIRSYTDQGFTKDKITILTCKTRESSILSDSTSIGSYRLCEDRSEKGILFTTAKKFKGLESDVIIFVDIDANTFKDAESRRVFYVGSSRARNFLDLVTVLSDKEESLLAEELTGSSKKNVRMSIMSGLKVKITKIDGAK